MPCYKEKVENSNAFVDRVVREGSGKETRKCVKLRLRKEREWKGRQMMCAQMQFMVESREYIQ